MGQILTLVDTEYDWYESFSKNLVLEEITAG